MTYFDRIKFGVSGTPGTSAITVGSAVTNFQTPAGASVPNSNACPILIEEGATWEVCDSVYTVSGTSQSRGTLLASSSGSRVSFTSAATVSYDLPAAYINAFLSNNVADQTISGGANVTVADLGTKSSGTLTIDCGTCPLQKVINGGAFTLAAPASDGSCMVLITNNGSAGAITFSGFSVPSSTGDALTTTNTNKFTLSIWRINGISGYRVSAHQ